MTADIVSLRAQGLSVPAIAKIDGRSASTIRRRLAESGRPSTLTEPERFWAKVEKTSTCWLWTAALDQSGYGLFRRQGAGAQGAFQRAHRVSYEWTKGEIGHGLHLDHLCRVRNCVNPEHLEPVTPRENTMRSPIAITALLARQVVCQAGLHTLGEGNRFPGAGSGRACRACQQERQARPVRCAECGKSMRSDSLAKHLRARHAPEPVVAPADLDWFADRAAERDERWRDGAA